jgi:hypothetical protein
MTLPLSILAVSGWRRVVRGWRAGWARRGVAAGLLAALLVPGLVWVVLKLVHTRHEAFFRTSDARALAFLDRSPRPGPVMAPVMPLGQAVPAFTGRQTFVGHYEWTPNMALRTQFAEALFDGHLSPAQATGLVRFSRASFLVADCAHSGVDLRHWLGTMIVGVRRFGCSTIYEIRSTGGGKP